MIKSLISPLVWFLLIAIGSALVGLWRSRSRARETVLLIAGLGLWLLSSPYVSHQLSQYIAVSAPTDSVTARRTRVIVLAGGSFRGNDQRVYLSERTIQRVMRGAEAFKNSQADAIIMTGRSVTTDLEPDSESEAMKLLAVRLGIPADKILLEARARTTFEHAPRILEAHLASPTDRVIIVSDANHLRRALREFRRYFPFVTPAVAQPLVNIRASYPEAWTPNASALDASTRVIQEWVGIGWYTFRHWRGH